MYKQVFNEDYSSLPQGSESFKFKTKNIYEDGLFRIEDEMYKFDFDLWNYSSTIKILESENAKIQSLSPAEIANYKVDERMFTTLKIK